MIKHIGNKWILYSKDGKKKLGTYGTKKEAEDREKEIVRIKAMKNKQFKQYEYDSNEDGSVNVRNVEIFIPGRHKGFDYSEEWWGKAIENFNTNKDGDFLPSVIIGHNDKSGEEKKSRGHVDNLILDSGVIKADLIKIPSDAFKEMKDRAYPHRSVEVNPDKCSLNALALLGGTAPHFKLPIMEFGEDEDSVIIDFAAQKTTTIQTLIFEKEKYEKAQKAKDWAKEHKFKNDKVDETEDSFRLRQINPGEFDPKSFRTIDIDTGIKAVIGKKKESFEEGDLETEINLDDNISSFQKIFNMMMKKIWDIFYNRDLSAEEKKNKIKKTAGEGAGLLKDKSDEFKEDSNMSQKTFTEEEVQAREDAAYDKKFQEQFGMSPEEFKQKKTDEAKKAKKSRIKAFADKLKERNIAASIIDDRIVPFCSALPDNGNVTFSDNGEDKTLDTISAFENLFDEIFKLNDEGTLVVDFSEKVKTEGGESVEEKFGEGDEAKMHEKAVKIAREKSGETEGEKFNEEYDKAIFSLTQKAGDSKK